MTLTGLECIVFPLMLVTAVIGIVVSIGKPFKTKIIALGPALVLAIIYLGMQGVTLEGVAKETFNLNNLGTSFCCGTVSLAFAIVAWVVFKTFFPDRHD